MTNIFSHDKLKIDVIGKIIFFYTVTINNYLNFITVFLRISNSFITHKTTEREEINYIILLKILNKDYLHSFALYFFYIKIH